MNIIRTVIAASMMLTSVAFAADEGAATLSSQQGTVLVNQGEEFVTASGAQVLHAGDRVMVMEGGSAEITYADGCVLPLASGSMVSVAALSTCAGEVAKVEQIGPTYAQAVGAPRDERCDDEDETNNDFDNDGIDDCPVAYVTDGGTTGTTSATGWTANNRGAGWIFGTWTAGILYALQASP
jgi:hypothetical protein